jgi:hypothetical protein
MVTQSHDEQSKRVADWFAERLPGGWSSGPARVDVDRDEILVLIPLPEGDRPGEFRQRTRAERIALARSAEETFGRKVSWGTLADGARSVFTNIRTGVTAELALTERRVLDSLVAGGVASNRSDAVAWCIRLVGRHEADWLQDLDDAAASTRGVPAEQPTEF